MFQTRIHLILIGMVAAIAVLGFACAGEDGSDGDNESLAGFITTDAEEGEFLAQSELSAANGDDALAFSARAASGDGANAPEAGPAADPQLQGLLDRKIIQSASIDVEVEDVNREFQEIVSFAEAVGGFVSSSSFTNFDDEQAADLTVRVPAGQYQSVLTRIHDIGTVTQQSSDANDVTEEFTDLQARLRTLEATEGRYLELLGRAETIQDILRVQDRLDGVRVQIEQLQGRINMLDQLTDLATITVHLRPETEAAAAVANEGGIHPLEAAASAWEYSLDALRGIAAVALIVAVFSWWLVPPLALLAFGTRWWLNRRPQVTEPVA